jgi:ribosomal protein L7/L12
MALAMNPGSQLTFYHKVFGETHLAGSLVQQLIDKGFKFDMSLYTLKVTGPNEKVKTLSLSLGTTTLMKGGNPSALPEKNKIWTWLHGMGVEQGLIVPAAEAIQQQVAQEQSPLATEFEIEGKKLFDVLLTGVDIDSKLAVIKAIRAITGCGLPEAKALADKAEEGVPVYIIKQVPLDTAGSGPEGEGDEQRQRVCHYRLQSSGEAGGTGAGGDGFHSGRMAERAGRRVGQAEAERAVHEARLCVHASRSARCPGGTGDRRISDGAGPEIR